MHQPKSLILHNGGLASAVAIGIACKIHTPSQVAVLTFGSFDSKRVKAAAAFCESLNIGLFIHKLPPYSTVKAIHTASNRGIDELVVGVYSRGVLHDAVERFNDLQDKVIILRGPDETISLRGPLVELEKVDLAKKAVDLELPLDLIRDCEAKTDKFCGVCSSCRIRIDAFRRAKLMDYDYEVEIDFDLPPTDQREYEEWRSGLYGV